MSTGVFVIINEWAMHDGATGSDVVDFSYFATEEGAREALHRIVQAYGEETADALDNFQVPEEKNLALVQYEEYYIQELTQA